MIFNSLLSNPKDLFYECIFRRSLSKIQLENLLRLEEMAKQRLKDYENIKLPRFKEMAKNIFLIPSALMFNEEVEKAFKILLTGRVGQRLIAKIGAGKHPIYIKESSQRSSADPDDLDSACNRNLGSSTIISLYLNIRVVFDQSTSTPIPSLVPLEGRVFDRNGNTIAMPFFLSLAHELIHALHNSYGKNKAFQKTVDRHVWSSDEEYHTIEGFPSKKATRAEPKITENAIRREHNLPERYGHAGHDLSLNVFFSQKE